MVTWEAYSLSGNYSRSALDYHVINSDGMSDKKLIANFMGLKFVRVGYIGTQGSDGETIWQKKNKEWFDSHYEFHDHSVGYYAVNVKENRILWQCDLNYKTSWDWLMPVVEKIEELGYAFEIVQENATIFDHDSKNNLNEIIPICGDSKIHATYQAVLEFIKWFQEQ